MIFDEFGLNKQRMEIVNDYQIKCLISNYDGYWGSSARLKYGMPIQSKGNNDENIESISWEMTHTAIRSWPNCVYFIGVVSNRTTDFSKGAYNGLKDSYGIGGNMPYVFKGNKRNKKVSAYELDYEYKKGYKENAKITMEYILHESVLNFYEEKSRLIYSLKLPTNIDGITHWYPCVSLRDKNDICKLSKKIIIR